MKPNAPIISGFYLVLGTALLASFFMPPTINFWQDLDQSWFFYANGSFKDSDSLQVFWALTNNRLFDLVPACSVLAIYAHFHIKNKAQIKQGISFGIFMALYVVLTVQIAHLIFDIGRSSPTLNLEPSYMLSKLVPWANPKDASGTSFPGDHATVLILVSLFIWHYISKPHAAIAFLVTFFAVLPRIVGGAHWLTDVLVGGVGIATFAFGFAHILNIPTIVTSYIEPIVHLGKRLKLF